MVVMAVVVVVVVVVGHSLRYCSRALQRAMSTQ